MHRKPVAVIARAVVVPSTLALLLLTASAAHAQTQSTAGVVQTHRLANGITVIVTEDRSAPVVSVASLYRVGARDDPPARSGLAHLLEHVLVFAKPSYSRRSTSPMFAVHGETAADFTTYTMEVAPGEESLALWMDAIRLTIFDHPKLVEQVLPAARSSLLNEEVQRIQNVPGGAVGQLVRGELFSPGHPYHHVFDSELASMPSAGRAELEAFHQRHYRPDNLVLSLVGDVDTDEILSLAERYLGVIPPAPAAGTRGTTALPAVGSKHLIIEASVSQPLLLVMYPVPERFAVGDAELAMLPALLGGNAGRLHTRLVRERGLASSVWLSHSSDELAGVLTIGLRPATGTLAKDLLAALDETLEGMRAGVDARDVTRVLARTSRNRLARLEQRMTRARSTAEAYAITGRTRALMEEVRRQATITVDGLRSALTRLRPEGRLVAVVEPTPEAPLSGRIRSISPSDRPTPGEVKPPPPPPVLSTTAARKPVIIPPPDSGFLISARPSDPPTTRLVLGNGLKVVVSSRRRIGLVHVSLVLPVGDAMVGRLQAGLAQATAELLMSGTERYPAASFTEQLAEIGMRMAARTEWGATVVSFEVASVHLPRALELFSDGVRSATFADHEVGLWKRERLQSGAAGARSSRRVAWEVVLGRLAPSSSIYALPGDGTTATIAGIGPEDLRRFHAAHYHPTGATLVVVGDVDATTIQPRLEQHLGHWAPARRAPAVPLPTLAAVPPPRALLVDLPGARHAQIYLATLLPVKSESERGMGRMLARELGGLIQGALREPGLAYDVRVTLMEEGPPIFRVMASVAPDRAGEATTTITRLLQERGATLSRSFSTSRERLIEDLARWGSTLTGLEEILVRGVISEVGDDLLTARLRSYESPLPDQVRAFAQAAFATDRLLTVVVGQRAAIEPSLRKAGAVAIVPNPTVPAALSPAAPPDPRPPPAAAAPVRR
jgi:zinc protease